MPPPSALPFRLSLSRVHVIVSSHCVMSSLHRLQSALDASSRGGKGGGKGDRAQGISQGVDTIDKAMEVARGPV